MSDSNISARAPIAIVGMSGRFPGARSLEHFWQNLRAGVESLDTFTDAELDAAGVDRATWARPGWVRRGTVLENVDMFDASFFGYSPREAQIMDPQHRVFLECAWEALEHAGYPSESGAMTVGVYAGTTMNSYVFSQLLADRELLAAVGGYQVMLGNDKDFLCTRVSYKLDLHGPSITVQTACSTSLVAVQTAVRALQRGECDMALAGGVSIGFPQRTGYEYQEGMIFSPDGTCRPFDAEAQGTRAGAGAGIVVLKRLDEAIADRDTIHAVIRGAAINNDGAGKAGFTAPSIDGQVEVIATAQALAGVEARSISYIEAHGTATPLGDPIEVAALTRAFRASTNDTGFCTIGSLKANIGHLDAAAGVAGLIKGVLALTHRELPPLPHFRSPNPQLDLPATPFRVATSAEPWESPNGPRRAGVSSFGIGGTNAHVVLEEAPAPAPTSTHRGHQLLVLSGRTSDAIAAATANLVAHLREHPSTDIADVAYTLQVGRREFAYRRSVVVKDAAEAIETLSRPERPPVVNAVHEGAARPVAFLFSGQGSQHAGMCGELYRTERVFREAVDRCAALLEPQLGRDLRGILLGGDEADVNATSVAQPLLFVSEYALATLWQSWGVRASAMLGHSIGEYVAAHLAGVLSLEDAMLLVAARGRLMQELPSGDMVAVNLSPDELRPRLPEGVEIAAVNAPALCTVSGSRDDVAALVGTLVRDGIEHRPLHTSHAFHSSMMEPALEPFREVVSRVTLRAPQVPYVSNVTGTWITPEEATSVDYYVRHLRGCVRFADGVAALAADSSSLLLEVGPGSALTSLARLTVGRDGASRVLSSMPHPREKKSDAETMLAAAGRLWAAGVAIDWRGMHAEECLHRIPLPTYPFERKRFFVDAPAAGTATRAKVASSSDLPQRRSDVGDWFHRPTWIRTSVAANHRVGVSGTWLVLGRGDALTSRVAARLESAGVSVIVARPGGAFSAGDGAGFVVRPGEHEDYVQLLRALRARGSLPDGVIHLGNAGPESSGTPDRMRSLHDLSALGRALVLEAPSSAMRLLVATTGAQGVMGEAITAPDRALLIGPVLVLPLEHDGLRVTAIDLDLSDIEWTERAAADVVEEAGIDDGEQFVARRAGLRWAKRLERAPLPAVDAQSLRLRPQGVYLITGGLGGIGVTLAEWLAARTGARLVLTTRSAIPARDAWDSWLADRSDEPTSEHIRNIRRIEAAGGEVLVATADTSDLAAMQRAVALGRAAWGQEFAGVVHTAGIKGDALLATSTREAADAVLDPKVQGVEVLREIFGASSLDFVVLCSSVSAAVGFAGTCAYSAANAYLDAFVASSRCPAGWNARAVAWDSWRDVGMAIRLQRAQPARTAPDPIAEGAIRPHEGADSFARALASGLAQHLVSPYDVPAVLEMRRRPATRVVRAATDAPERAVAPADHSSDGDTSGTPDVAQQLALVWKELLGVDAIDVDDNFFELGGHSLLATRVLARIDGYFGVRLPLRAVFEAPTLRQLSELILSQTQLEAVPAGAPPDGEREEFEL